MLKSATTLRHEMFARAGIVQYPAGRATLTLSRNLPARALFEKISQVLAHAA